CTMSIVEHMICIVTLFSSNFLCQILKVYLLPGRRILQNLAHSPACLPVSSSFSILPQRPLNLPGVLLLLIPADTDAEITKAERLHQDAQALHCRLTASR